MARGPKPTVRYWLSRKAYACWIGKDRHFLTRGPDDAPNGPTYLEALDRFRKLKDRDLRPHHVEDFFSRQTDRWNATTKSHAGTLILSAVSWARKKGFIEYDPLAGRVDLPPPILRGREAKMSDELLDLMIAESRVNMMRSQEFADMLWILRETGARPIELRKAEAFNDEEGKIIFRWNTTRGDVHKTAVKTQRDRVIFLTPAVQAYQASSAPPKPFDVLPGRNAQQGFSAPVLA